MWELEELVKYSKENHTNINGKWVATRPLNFTKDYTSLFQRLRWAWEVLQGKSETFVWSENQ